MASPLAPNGQDGHPAGLHPLLPRRVALDVGPIVPEKLKLARDFLLAHEVEVVVDDVSLRIDPACAVRGGPVEVPGLVELEAQPFCGSRDARFVTGVSTSPPSFNPAQRASPSPSSNAFPFWLTIPTISYLSRHSVSVARRNPTPRQARQSQRRTWRSGRCRGGRATGPRLG